MLSGRRRAGVLVALFLCALALRPQLVGVGPLLPRIESGLEISHAIAGLLATIPVLCMGLFAPSAAHLLERVGSRTAIAACLGLIAVAGALRAVMPGALAVLLVTIPIGIGIGLGGALLPVAVKERFADRPAFATGVYATGINVGSALSSAAAVPLARAAGGWRASLLVFAAVSAVLVPVWLALTRRFPAHRRVDVRIPRLPIRSGIGWVLVLLFGVMGTCFYGLNSWLADSFVERGWSEGSAGALIGVLNIASIPGALLVPWLADRIGSRRPYLVTSAALFAGGTLGLATVPDAGWLFATVTGLGVGGLFPLVLTLPLDVVDRPADVGAYAGLMLGAGYCIAAVAPFALGAVRDATGSFTAVLWTIVALASLLLVACIPLSQQRLHRARRTARSE